MRTYHLLLNLFILIIISANLLYDHMHVLISFLWFINLIRWIEDTGSIVSRWEQLCRRLRPWPETVRPPFTLHLHQRPCRDIFDVWEMELWLKLRRRGRRWAKRILLLLELLKAKLRGFGFLINVLDSKKLFNKQEWWRAIHGDRKEDYRSVRSPSFGLGFSSIFFIRNHLFFFTFTITFFHIHFA